MTTQKRQKQLDLQAKRGLGALGALVVALILLVWWAATTGGETAGPREMPEEQEDAAATTAIGLDVARRPLPKLRRPATAGGELMVLTDAADDVVAAKATPGAIAKTLDVAYCGPACDPVRELVADRAHVTIETKKGDEIILPPKDTLDTVAPGLGTEERARLFEKRSAVVVRVQGGVTPDQIPARALFGVTALLADQLGGVVYDETTRRIETATQAKQRVIKAPLGEQAFSPRHVIVQFYRTEDGSARLLTLGMDRFGSPDFTASGATMAAGALLVDLLNAIGAKVAAGNDALPLMIGPADVGRTGGAPVTLHVVEPIREQGDPEDLVEIIPPGGNTREAWEDVVDALFGEKARSVETRFDEDMKDAAARARDELGAVLARREKDGGELFVWAPFPIPEDERAEDGPEEEWLWVKVTGCDEVSCTGTLSNRPMYASNIASGKTTRVARSQVADWLVRLPDGGVLGGKTSSILAGHDR